MNSSPSHTTDRAPVAARPRTRPRRAKPAPIVRDAQRLFAWRFGGLPSWVILTQLFIGFGWLRAVAEKVIDPHWWNGDAIRQFALEHQGATVGWYRPFLDSVVLPLAPFVALVVVACQLVAGASLATGKQLRVGLGVGMYLNLHFMATGAVTPSAFYLLAQGTVALWLAERSSSARTARQLGLAAGVAVFLAVWSLPFISTLHPAEVIEDPAMMFAFGGALAAMACLMASAAPQPRNLVAQTTK